MLSTKRESPSAARNRDPILEVLRRELPVSGTILEIASGTGEHAVHFARHLPGIVWQPSDVDDEALASIDAWVLEADLPNLRRPLRVDVSLDPPAPATGREISGMVCINMLHISPWSACQGLFRRAGSILPGEGPLVVYGPFIRDGVETAPSNLAFDASLRSRSPAWGLRTLEAVDGVAQTHGLERAALTVMPANNVTVVYRKRRVAP